MAYPIAEDWRSLPENQGKKRKSSQPIPTGHPRRCQHTNRKGLQCGKYALKSEKYCKTHFRGGIKRTRNYSRALPDNPYLRKTSQKFRELVEGHAKADSDLTAEIEVARGMTERTILLLDKLTTAPDGESDTDKNKRELAALKMLPRLVKMSQDGLDQVASLLIQQVKLAASANLSPADMEKFIKGVLDCVIEELGPESEAAKRICSRIDRMSGTSGPSVTIQI